MKTKIKIDDAIEALKRNLNEHIVEYTDAIEVWTRDAVEALQKVGQAVTREGLKTDTRNLWAVFNAKPVDNRSQYSRLITFFESGQKAGETHIEGDEDDCDQIFNDNWDWRVSSKMSNSAYASRK